MTAGFLEVDKPPGITSHDVVSVLRAVFGVKKIGHTGTLDPFATGVLPMAIGHATRLIPFLDEGIKGYEATLLLGQKTDTADCDGEVIASHDVPSIDARMVEDAMRALLGDRQQRPPMYSAVKVAGKPLYKYAREGAEVEVKARPIRIDEMSLLALDGCTLRFSVRCSRGTYVRVLGESLAELLGTVGHLTQLRRTCSGSFTLAGSLAFEELSELVSGRRDWRPVLRRRRDEPRVEWRPRDAYLHTIQERLLSPEAALAHLPRLEIGPEDRRMLRIKGVVESAPSGVEDGDLWRVDIDGRMRGVMRYADGRSRVARMLPDG